MFLGNLNQPRLFPHRKATTPPPITETRQQLGALPPGLAGIETSLGHMRRFVESYKVSPIVRETAIRLVQGIPQKDFGAEVSAIFDFVKYHIRYIKDITGTETIQSPAKTLEYRAGDCDDKATLLAALLESLGHETRFYAVGFTPDSISHVLLQCNINGQWIALETTEPVSMGWTPPDVLIKRFA